MTKLDADTLLDAIDSETPISADDFQDRMTNAAKVEWCDLSYKGRFEDAADEIWDVIDEISQVVQVDDVIEAAHAILDIVERSGKLDETQEDELADLRNWIDAEGPTYNLKRSLN